MSKYDDTPERRRLRDTIVPGPDKRWSEFVFLSPVHPHATWSAWREIRGKELPRMEFWAIPADVLPQGTVVVWESGRADHEVLARVFPYAPPLRRPRDRGRDTRRIGCVRGAARADWQAAEEQARDFSAQASVVVAAFAGEMPVSASSHAPG